jgi:hypothetical protein
MKKLGIIAVVLLSLLWPISNLWARPGLLNCSYDQCVESLGKPEGREPSRVTPATEAFSFVKNGWGIMVHFWNKESHCITYTKIGTASISSSEISAIIDGYDGGNSWIESKTGKNIYNTHFADPAGGLLIRSDKEVIIDVSSVSTIMIYTTKFYKAALSSR